MNTAFNTTALPIVIGSDHAGFAYKAAIINWLKEEGFSVIDKGTDSEASTDYPDYAHPVAEQVEQQQAAVGFLVCGSGNGVCMTANKHANIRASLCWNEELAQLSRQHNDANILCIPARFVSLELAKDMVKAFLTTEFEGGRHANRVAKISC